MMKETELTSGDFVRDLAVENGRISKAVGMTPIFFPKNSKNGDVLTEASGVRNCVAFTSRAVAVGMGREITVKITERADLNYSIQVYAEMIVAFVRTEGATIQKVQTPA